MRRQRMIRIIAIVLVSALLLSSLVAGLGSLFLY
ncbi:stressosome-associated protein Prli42 [Paenibacillus sp. FSL H8-0548]|nr:stressosome-associated protein Prli42 [Paenibacillus sp. FSL H8-0548]